MAGEVAERRHPGSGLLCPHRGRRRGGSKNLQGDALYRSERPHGPWNELWEARGAALWHGGSRDGDLQRLGHYPVQRKDGLCQRPVHQGGRRGSGRGELRGLRHHWSRHPGGLRPGKLEQRRQGHRSGLRAIRARQHQGVRAAGHHYHQGHVATLQRADPADRKDQSVGGLHPLRHRPGNGRCQRHGLSLRIRQRPLLRAGGAVQGERHQVPVPALPRRRDLSQGHEQYPGAVRPG